MIVVVDYGMGNLHSVAKALEKAGGKVNVTAEPSAVAAADKLVLPGVGAFKDAKDALDRVGLRDPILDHITSGKKFLGICLGLQLLFERSHEDGEHAGLGVLRGEVVRFKAEGLKVPHIGWNTLDLDSRVGLFAGVPAGSYVYFVHSYYVVCADDSAVAARTDYAGPFASAVARHNVWAVQFHPEKSQRLGIRMLENFVKW